MRPLLWPAALAALTLVSAALASIEADYEAVLKFGPRVTGSAANEQARRYLETQFQALGYQTRREAFRYVQFADLGSDVRRGAQVLEGHALNDSAGGQVSAALVRVPGVGLDTDFARVDVRGKMAVVARGQIPFLQKAQGAVAAGAAGLIVVNNVPGTFRGTLGQRVNLPVLGVSAEVGAALADGEVVQLNVRVREGEVQGQNVVAFKSGVTRPELLFGAHLDSVPGAPGANDNLSGTLTVLELARRAVNTPLSARAYFVLFDGEEDGLRGSRAFVEGHPAVVTGLKAMLNLDMVGVAVTPLTLTGDAALTDLARRVTGVQALAQNQGGSDHVPFAQAGVPTLFFHRGLDEHYHQPGDTILDPALLRESAEVALKVADAALLAVPARP